MENCIWWSYAIIGICAIELKEEANGRAINKINSASHSNCILQYYLSIRDGLVYSLYSSGKTILNGWWMDFYDLINER